MVKIKRIIAFGDSLQDNGNLYQQLDLPRQPYFEGRFSDGPTATELFAQYIAKSQWLTVKSINFAVGGALTSGQNPKFFLRHHAHSVACQVDQFISLYGRLSPQDLVVINGGGNNFLFAVSKIKPYIRLSLLFKVASDLLMQTERLIQNGAHQVMLWNLGDVTLLPAYEVLNFPSWIKRTMGYFYKRQVVMQNEKLLAGVRRLRKKYPHVAISIFDLYSLSKQAIITPETYGFSNATEPCVNSFGGMDELGQPVDGLTVDHDISTHLFWDYVHPSAKGHTFLAEHMYQQWMNCL